MKVLIFEEAEIWCGRCDNFIHIYIQWSIVSNNYFLFLAKLLCETLARLFSIDLTVLILYDPRIESPLRLLWSIKKCNKQPRYHSAQVGVYLVLKLPWEAVTSYLIGCVVQSHNSVAYQWQDLHQLRERSHSRQGRHTICSVCQRNQHLYWVHNIASWHPGWPGPHHCTQRGLVKVAATQAMVKRKKIYAMKKKTTKVLVNSLTILHVVSNSYPVGIDRTQLLKSFNVWIDWDRSNLFAQNSQICLLGIVHEKINK